MADKKEPITINVLFGDAKNGLVLGGFDIPNASEINFKKVIARAMYSAQFISGLDTAIDKAKEFQSRVEKQKEKTHDQSGKGSSPRQDKKPTEQVRQENCQPEKGDCGGIRRTI